MDHLQSIRDAVAGRRAILVLGTGVTTATVANPRAASWIGLLGAGVDYLEKMSIVADPDYLRLLRTQISTASNPAYNDQFTAVAESLVHQMGGKGSTYFSDFLRATIGQLSPDPGKLALLNALAELNLPIITTNYDTVLESALNLREANWTHERQFLDAVQGERGIVAHLHGIWTEPESIVLTSADYQLLLNNHFVEAVKQGVGGLSTLVFVGFGAGLADPTFVSLLDFIRTTMPSSVAHFTLCRDADLPRAATHFKGTNIIPLGYGSEYTQLPKFIRDLAPADPAGQLALVTAADVVSQHEMTFTTNALRTTLLESLSDDSLLSGVLAKGTDREVKLPDVVITPSILPVPYDVYVADRRGPNPSLERLDAQSEALREQVAVLVGDAQSGVTTTLKWMALTRSEADGTVPVYLDITRIHLSGPRPISNAVRRTLRSAGAGLANRAPLPDNITLVLDNVGLSARAKTRVVLNDALSLHPKLLVVGTRSGAESEVQAALNDLTGNCTLMYTGRVGRRYAEEIARRVGGVHIEAIATRALEVAHRECLSRTPMSVALLVIGVSQAEDWVDSASNTTYIDAYIDSLLGRGDPSIDSRIEIDSEGYSRVLQDIAEYMVKEDCDSMSRDVLYARLSALFGLLDWQEDPALVLLSLRLKGLLVERDNIVRFKTATFLHIFSARRAERSEHLLSYVRSRPLRYSGIISHYAARKRDDQELLAWANELLAEADQWETPSTGVFARRDQSAVDAEADRLEEFARALDLDADDPSGNGSDDTPYSNDASLDPYEDEPEVEKAPYPSSSIESAPLQVQVIWLLTLVSNIVRDSDLIEDPALKQRALERTLRVWGHFVNILGASEETEQLVDALADQIGQLAGLGRSQLDALRSWLHDSWALAVGLTGIRSELLTRKLGKAAARIGGDADKIDIHLALMKCVLLCEVGDRGWVECAHDLWLRFPGVRIVRAAILIMATLRYFDTLDPGLQLKIEDLLTDIEEADLLAAGRSVKGFRERNRSYLRRSRARRISLGRARATLSIVDDEAKP